MNISVDGAYRFSLDIYQVSELGLKIGNDYSEIELVELETESQFGKLYSRALEYCLMRPHSSKEIKDYLWKKTLSKKYKSRDGEIREREGVSGSVANRVHNRLLEKGYIDDERFSRWWIENRNQRKGSSIRKLGNELRAKGVTQTIIDQVTANSSRNDDDELRKVIEKKAKRYDDRQKFTQYLVGQGFSYDDIKRALAENLDQENDF